MNSEHACILCGSTDTEGGRRHPLQRLVARVKLGCKMSPFVYRHIVARRGEGACRTCSACSSWMSRLRTTGGKRRLVPMDALLLFVQNPIREYEPDSRAFDRLVGVAMSSDWAYAVFRTPLLRKALEGKPSKALDLVRVWWDWNGRPSWFQTASTARYVRRLLSGYRGRT